MPTAPENCMRCRGTMEPGFVVDKGHHSAPGQQVWAEGGPERSFWTGLKMKGKRTFTVLTYRCERCGYLESYAEEQIEKQ